MFTMNGLCQHPLSVGGNLERDSNVNGTWTLYVLDTAGGNRGVVAGGWQLDYRSDAVATSTQTLVRAVAQCARPPRVFINASGVG